MKGHMHMAVALLALAVSGALARAQCPGCDGCAGGAGGHDGCAGGHGQGVHSPSGKDLTGFNNNNLYDRCWFDRYANLSHRAVNRAFTPQVQNGHVLDQTVWNHMFECGSDVLNCMGQAHLQYLSRRRPEADRVVYLATAMDLKYDPACPDRYCGARQELDALRVASIQRFLTGLNCGRCPDFQVLVHDPADVTISTIPAAWAVTQMYARYRGGLLTGAGGQGGAGGFAGSGGAIGGGGGFGGGGASTGSAVPGR